VARLAESWSSSREATRREFHRRVGRKLEAAHVGREGEVAGELARHFQEAGDPVRNKDYWIMGGRIECLRYDAERDVLTVSFRLFVQDGEDEADGVAYCQVG
jgi:hypothetical protein